MLNHKSDLILEYNETTGENLKRNDVDWSQSKVIFVAPSFTSYQREAIGFNDLPIELYEIKKYANNTITFTQILAKQSSESITTISKTNEKVKAVNKEIKIYTESNRKEAGSLEMQELYDKVKRMILNIGDDISIKATKFYIAFIRKTNFCNINIQKNQIKIWLNVKKGKLEDSKKIARNVADIGHWGNGDYEIALNSDADIEYVVSLIRQSYNLNE
jgi:predicted transport protein